MARKYFIVQLLSYRAYRKPQHFSTPHIKGSFPGKRRENRCHETWREVIVLADASCCAITRLGRLEVGGKLGQCLGTCYQPEILHWYFKLPRGCVSGMYVPPQRVNWPKTS